jgi:hypothetical protein
MSKLRLKYDIIAKRAEETESGVNIDEALRRRKTEIQNISNSLNQTNVEVQQLGDTVNAAVEVVDGMNDRVTAVEDAVSETSGDLIMLEDYVDGLAVDLENKLDREDSAYFYPMETNPSGYLTDADMSEYAKQQWVEDQGYLKSADLSDYAKTAEVDIQFDETSAWAKSVFASATQLSDYYPKTETSGASELRAEFEKYQPSGQYVTTTELDAELASYPKTAEVSHSIEQATSGKMDKSTSAQFYPMYTNPSGYLTTADMSQYATKPYVLDAIDSATSGFLTSADLDDYAQSAWVSENFVDEVELDDSIDLIKDWASETFQTSGEYVTSEDLEDALVDYYTKDETSGAAEIEEALKGYQPSGEYVTSAGFNEEIAKYYQKNETSGASELSTEFDKYQTKGPYVTSAGLTAELVPYAKTADVNQSIVEATSGKLDKSSSGEFYPMHMNPSGYLTEHQDLSSYATKLYVTENTSAFITSSYLDPYAETDFVNEELAKKQDASEMSAYATSSWVDTTFQQKGDYVETSELDNYYTKDETSGASEIRDALAEKAPVGDYVETSDLDTILEDYVTSAGFDAAIDDYYKKSETSGATELEAEFKKYQTSGEYLTSAGLDEVLDDYKTASEVEDDLADTSAWAKSVFASAAQLSDYATTQELRDGLNDKLDKTESANYYPMTGNPSNFLVQADLAGYATQTYVNQETSGKLDKSESANYWPQASANAVIPAGTDASNQLVNELGLATAMADFGGFKKSTPDASGKPTEADPSTKIIYLTYVSSAAAPDKYNEWIWDSDVNDYELIGDTTLDLTGYATENYVDQHTSGKIDWTSSGQFYLASNPDGFIDSTALEPYAQTTYVDAGLNKKFDTSAMSAYAESAWVAANFQSAGQFVTSAGFNEAIAEYYKKNETSGAAELTAEFAKYQLEGDYVTSAGLTEKLNETSAWANEKFQPVGPYATTTDLDNTSAWAKATFASASQLDDYYPNTNPSGFITNEDLTGLATETYVQSQTSGKLDKSSSGAFYLATNPDHFVTSGELATLSAKIESDIPSLDGYATEEWVGQQGYLTSVPSEYVTDTEMGTAIETATSGKMDKSTSAQFYPRSTNPEHYVTSGELSTLSAKIESDIPSIDGLAAESWVQANFASASQLNDMATQTWVGEQGFLTSVPDTYATSAWAAATFASASQLNDYYPNTNPSGFLNAIPSEYITETELETELGSYAEVDDLNYVSGAVDSLKDDVDYVSGAFAGYATTQDLNDGLALKLNKTDSGAFYPMTGNPSGFLTSIPDTYATKTYVEQETSGKVDKETGKGLSTNDFTNSLKTKLTEIETSAQMNVIEVVKVDDTALPITNKSVNVTLSGKVDKIEGKGLSTNDLTDAYVTTIETAAEVIPSDADENNQLVSTDTLHAAIADFGGFMKVAGDSSGYPVVSDPDTRTIYLVKDASITSGDVYAEWIWNSASPSVWEMVGDTQIDLDGYVEYPSTHIDQHIVLFGPGDTIVDSQMTLDDVHGDVSGVTVAGGSELTITDHVVDIPAAYANNGTYYPGVMSALDKAKLDAINASAERNVQADWNESDPTSDAYIKNKPAQLELIGRDGIEVSATQNSVYVSVSGNYLTGEAASGLDVPMKIKVVSTMPSTFDPNTIYLVQGTYIGT